jgi:hypothetical protein
MKGALTETSIVRATAEDAATRVTRKVVRALQKMKHTLSGDDSELKTTWDEICAQVQCEESFFWDTYEATVRDLVAAYTSPSCNSTSGRLFGYRPMRVAIGNARIQGSPRLTRCSTTIVDYLIHQYVYAEAGRWSNARIRAFIERSTMTD